MPLRLVAAAAIILAALPGGAAPAGAQSPPGAPGAGRALEQAARRTIQERRGVPPGQLEVLGETTATYPTLGREGVAFKLLDRRTGRPYAVLLGRDGQSWDAAAVEAQERAAYDARYGRLDARLFERLQRTRDDEELEVVAWLRTPSSPAPAGAGAEPAELGDAQAEGYFAQRARQRAEAIAAARAALASRLAGWGGTAQDDAEPPGAPSSRRPATTATPPAPPVATASSPAPGRPST
jgi:hypothetical protein